ncbi:uncharacterized protein LOC131958199 [Physella acuta]|uniref:uncharacterized protein LOC131958199 n=1 Tax=Physella acuta TaxID=109671 RepID=UPI0027DAD194|nr:uncharacterized protein LOC131958199 [Physella acuta]
MYRELPALTNGEVATPSVPAWDVDIIHPPTPAVPTWDVDIIHPPTPAVPAWDVDIIHPPTPAVPTWDVDIIHPPTPAVPAWDVDIIHPPTPAVPAWDVDIIHPPTPAVPTWDVDIIHPPTPAVPTWDVDIIHPPTSATPPLNGTFLSNDYFREEMNSAFNGFNSPHFLPLNAATATTVAKQIYREINSVFNSPDFLQPNLGMFQSPGYAVPTPKIASVSSCGARINEESDSAHGYSNSPAFCRPNYEQHYTERMPPFPSNQTTEITDETELSNAIGQLKHLYGTQPTFETSCEGPPHNRLYICRVTLHGRTTEGTARTSKLASRIAAAKMLKVMSPAKVPDHTGSKSGAYKISCERTIVHEKFTVTVDTREEQMECE